jgi:hypothetical protein
MLIQEVYTDHPPAEVVRLAKEFFLTRFSPYGADVDGEGDGYVSFRLEAGELVIGAGEDDGRTLVRGSTSRIHHELSQFLTLLNVAEEVRQNVPGPGASGSG